MRGPVDCASLPERRYAFITSSEEFQMKAKQKGKTAVVQESASRHPYKKYESHRYWKKIDKGISDLVDNQDLVEQSARPYIVGYLCKMILSRKEQAKGT
jgi:hypothetical protein